jgi:ACS family hexuronate transporter-like MFS transporter
LWQSPTWRGAFVATGATGLVWLALLALLLSTAGAASQRLSKAELQLILSDPIEKVESVPWRRVLPCKETWAFAIAKFLTDPIWWFYLFWLPRYLQSTFGLSIAQNRLPVVMVYVIATVGSIGGGGISAVLLKRGKNLNVSRKTALLICALCVVPVFSAPFLHNLWSVVAVVGLAAAAHQGWSANVFTLPSDMFPKAAVASVTGIGGMAGAVEDFCCRLLPARL